MLFDTHSDVAVELLRGIDIPLTIRCGRMEPTSPDTLTRLIVKVRFMPHATRDSAKEIVALLRSLIIPSSADTRSVQGRPLECFGGPNRLSKVGGDCSGEFSVPWPKLPETLVPESSFWKNVMLPIAAERRATGNYPGQKSASGQ